jgi:hypothetical protein
VTPQLSVITPVPHPPGPLWPCLDQVEAQTLAGIQHIVVADGPNPTLAEFCRTRDVTYLELPQPGGDRGRPALDLGLTAARAPYVVFWYPQNTYPPDAAYILLGAARGFDLGIVRIRHWIRAQRSFVTIPRHWDGRIQLGDIDAASGCVRRGFLSDHGLTPGTIAPGEFEGDGRLWQAIQQRGGTINYSPAIVLAQVSWWPEATATA